MMSHYFTINDLECIKNSQLLNEVGGPVDMQENFRKIKIKPVILIENNEDLANILESLRFHMVKSIPNEVSNYILSHQKECQNIINKYKDLLVLLPNNVGHIIFSSGEPKNYELRDVWVQSKPEYINLIKKMKPLEVKMMSYMRELLKISNDVPEFKEYMRENKILEKDSDMFVPECTRFYVLICLYIGNIYVVEDETSREIIKFCEENTNIKKIHFEINELGKEWMEHQDKIEEFEEEFEEKVDSDTFEDFLGIDKLIASEIDDKFETWQREMLESINIAEIYQYGDFYIVIDEYEDHGIGSSTYEPSVATLIGKDSVKCYKKTEYYDNLYLRHIKERDTFYHYFFTMYPNKEERLTAINSYFIKYNDFE